MAKFNQNKKNQNRGFRAVLAVRSIRLIHPNERTILPKTRKVQFIDN